MNEQSKKLRNATVAKDYHAQYSDPIVMRSGDEIVLGERDTENVDWIWSTSSDGRSGWAPVIYLSIDGGSGRALRDYSAMELTATAGEVIEICEEHSGWVLATNSRGESGWLPAEHLKVEGITMEYPT